MKTRASIMFIGVDYRQENSFTAFGEPSPLERKAVKKASLKENVMDL